MLMMLIVLLINLMIPVCIGVFVYRDAKARGMEALLWTLAAVLIPGFIGLIVYLIARTKYSVLRCARCGAVVEESYAVCPQCGVNLQASCPACGRTVQPDWHLCAHCGQELSRYRESNVVEPPSAGKSLWIALGIIAVLAILILFVLASNLVWYWVPQGTDMIRHMIHHSI